MKSVRKVVVIVVPVGGRARVETIDDDLGAMQRLVGGSIQCVHLGKIDLWCNDEGLYTMAFNRCLGPHAIHGQFFLTRRSGSRIASVTNEDIAAWVVDPAQESA